MTHIPYIAVSYGLATLVPLGLALQAWRRLTGVRRRLAALERRP